KYFFTKINELAADYTIRVNGDTEIRIPNNVNISVPGISGEQLVIELDVAGIVCGAQSACNAKNDEESYVVAALYSDADVEAGSLRFSMGRETTQKDIDETVQKLSFVLKKLVSTKERFDTNFTNAKNL